MTLSEAETELADVLRLHRSGQPDMAEAAFRRLMARHPSDPYSLSRLGRHARDVGLVDLAVPCLQLAASLAPKEAEILTDLATALAAVPRYDVAIDALERSIAVNSAASTARYELGRVLNNSGQPDRALVISEQLKRQRPDFIGARMNIVGSLAQLGRFADADREALAIIDQWPEQLGGYVAISHARKFKAGDPLIAKAQKLADSGQHDVREQRDLHFALGKMYDDIDAVDEAFAAFSRANELDPTRYDRHGYERRYRDIREGYPKALFGERSHFGFNSTVPVFVVGMPRSGTTLIESILAAHPEVTSIGESHLLRAADQSIGEFTRRDEPSLASAVASLSAEATKILGQRYVSKAAKRARDKSKTRIVDKMPHNFVNLGLAALMLPDAKIIHVRRSPMATALSCWMQSFNQFHEYSGRFDDLAHHYALYRKMMSHWRDVLGDRILDVDYEDVARKPGEQAKRMLAWIGVSQDGFDLEERRKLRVVTTASVWQVRQPVYQQSIERWHAYEKHLDPLKQAFADHGVEPR